MLAAAILAARRTNGVEQFHRHGVERYRVLAIILWRRRGTDARVVRELLGEEVAMAALHVHLPGKAIQVPGVDDARDAKLAGDADLEPGEIGVPERIAEVGKLHPSHLPIFATGGREGVEPEAVPCDAG